ncbi:MAG TPA: RdgB/HAM1 family non-canonical purine NTP pyrophosphatase [Pyrinomonadaceae bacterium]|nr:RdgB/HAM1 family non-canonical purine NTP pyrophosphatase [Pyrinomonadaceae bacterium]
MNRRLLLGTRNPGKVKEITTILEDSGWTFSSLQEFAAVGPAAEDGVTYAENAIAKARFYAAATGLLALADDSGLEVAALGGAPGVYSARYAGEGASDADRRALLLAELSRVDARDRRARFVASVAIAHPNGEVLNLSEGICEGTITFEPRGNSGFGYDPLFVPDGYYQTFAELSDEVKNRISHRARALMRLRDSLDHLEPAS